MSGSKYQVASRSCFSSLPCSLLRATCYRTPFDLHALGTPPAFILSQDQTLRHLRVLSLTFSFITTLQLSRCNGLRGALAVGLTRIAYSLGPAKRRDKKPMHVLHIG